MKSTRRGVSFADGASRAEMVYSTLTTLIREGGLKPGDRVRESDIAKRFHVSRTPVREALRRLESEGLVSSAPRRGLSVTKLSLTEVLELYALREVLEGFAAGLAAQYASSGEISNLRNLLARQSGLTNPGALDQLNRQFHQTIHVAARNRYLLHTLHSLRDALALLPGTTYSAPGRPAAALREHRKIAIAIERRDAGSAEQAAREHIRAAVPIRQSMISDST